MITSIRNFKLLGVQRGITLSYHAQVRVTEVTFPFKVKETILAIHSPGVCGKWFWSDTNQACPYSVELLASDDAERNKDLWSYYTRNYH